MQDAASIEAFVALGSNLGDSNRILEAAFARLQQYSAAPIRRSSLWHSAPVDCPPGSPDFVNAAAALVPLRGETPESLLARLQSLEVEFGRRPKAVFNEPRPLDLDLIAFGDEVRATPQLTLPHPRAHLRRFVLEPLAEIAPACVLPGQTRTIRDLCAACALGDGVSMLSLTFAAKAARPCPNTMPAKTIIKPAKSPSAVGPYNHAVRIADLLFSAGQIPLDPATGNLIAGDIKAQTERVLENVKAILDDQKLTFANVVKTTVFLTNLGDFAGMNEVYAKYFTGDFPARSTIQVSALPKGANVEIEVVAHY